MLWDMGERGNEDVLKWSGKASRGSEGGDD